MSLTKYSWKTLRKYIQGIYPELANIIDDISPSDDYSLYVGEYPYGALILDKGVFQVVNDDGKLVPLTHASISKNTQEDLTYTGTMPMGMVSKNAIETYFSTGKNNAPYSSTLFSQNGMIALWCALEENQTYQSGPIWNVSSGARTICMLPKITDKTGYEFLKKKYKLKIDPPQSLYDHWPIFVTLVNHQAFPQQWNSELIFFPKKWFANKNDKAWASFYQFLMNKVWNDSVFRRNQYIFDFAFSLLQENKNLKPNPYLADTVKHLIAVGAGEAVALTPAIDSIVAPIEGIQKIFLEDYDIKKYFPIIMHSHHFNPNESRAVYYSLEMPTTTIFSPRSSQAFSKMADLRELKHISEVFFSETLKGNLMIEKTPLFNLTKNVSYNFYHSDHDQYNEISNVANLVKIDPAFNKILSISKDLEFPEFSPFFKGCICIKKAE